MQVPGNMLVSSIMLLPHFVVLTDLCGWKFSMLRGAKFYANSYYFAAFLSPNYGIAFSIEQGAYLPSTLLGLLAASAISTIFPWFFASISAGAIPTLSSFRVYAPGNSVHVSSMTSDAAKQGVPGN